MTALALTLAPPRSRTAARVTYHVTAVKLLIVAGLLPTAWPALKRYRPEGV